MCAKSLGVDGYSSDQEIELRWFVTLLPSIANLEVSWRKFSPVLLHTNLLVFFWVIVVLQSEIIVSTLQKVHTKYIKHIIEEIHSWNRYSSYCAAHPLRCVKNAFRLDWYTRREGIKCTMDLPKRVQLSEMAECNYTEVMIIRSALCMGGSTGSSWTRSVGK